MRVTDWGTSVQAETRTASVAALTFEALTSSGNRDGGVRLIDADGSRVAGSTSRDNGGTGIVFDEFGPDSGVADSAIADIGDHGLLLFDGGGCFALRRAEITGNRLAGVETSNGGQRLLVTDSLLAGSGGAGVHSEDVSSPSVRDNEITGNAGD